MTTDTTQKMTVMGQTINQVQKVTFFLSWTPLDKDKDGNWTVKQKIDGLKMEIEIGGNKSPFDPNQDKAGTNPPSDSFKTPVSSEFTLTLDKDTKVSTSEGREELMKELATRNQG